MTSVNMRNVAIIAHVDHGKTTLVDQLLKQCGNFRANQDVPDRILDSNSLERERGITILAKNTSIHYADTKINIVDTPGHADFGGEVERIVKMVDGVLLLVDAAEGPMPQTRFVLRKALQAGLKPVVVINKVDRHDARIPEVLDELLDLFIDLDASEEQLDFPVIFASAKQGFAALDAGQTGGDMRPLLDAILEHIPAPSSDASGPLQLLISSLQYDNYVGRIGIGKIIRGTLTRGEEVVLHSCNGQPRKVKVSSVAVFEGLKRTETEQARAGEIVSIAGIENLYIGDTLCSPLQAEPVPFVSIDQPTISVNFLVNDSPMAGQEGSFVTSRQLRERLLRETLSDVALHVEEISPDCFKVSGRGELHLAILMETMRREGYEFAVSRPEVILQEEAGSIQEPFERLLVEVPEEYVGTVIERTARRKGELLELRNNAISRLEFLIPARGLIGFRQEFLTETRGTGIMHHVFDSYQPFKGEIIHRNQGVLVASESGVTVIYGLYNAQERGTLFIGPGTRVYAGMIVGGNPRNVDIAVNVCKTKHLTNTRASGSDEALRLVPPTEITLEKALEFINGDELLEVTPRSLRLRKIILDKNARERQRKRDQAS